MESTYYPYLGALAWIGIFLLIGTILRAKIKFFQSRLLPASLIGGLVGFVFFKRWLAWNSKLNRLKNDQPGSVQYDHVPSFGIWLFRDF